MRHSRSGAAGATPRPAPLRQFPASRGAAATLRSGLHRGLAVQSPRAPSGAAPQQRPAVRRWRVARYEPAREPILTRVMSQADAAQHRAALRRCI